MGASRYSYEQTLLMCLQYSLLRRDVTAMHPVVGHASASYPLADINWYAGDPYIHWSWVQARLGVVRPPSSLDALLLAGVEMKSSIIQQLDDVLVVPCFSSLSIDMFSLIKTSSYALLV